MVEEKIVETINKYNMISQNDKIVVAVSGGPDSMTLLNALVNLKEKLNLELYVSHVNHMIRDVADEETQYVQDYCLKKNIKCFVKKVDVIKIAEKEKISTEEAGRNIRYDFFEEVYNEVGANKIAIAHNQNDNAETVLMNILRGTGIAGLKGIDPVRQEKYIRPLIEIDRADIEEYCKAENLNPKFDESNNENIYTRNKIRNLLIPYLKENFNPNIIESVNRLSSLAKQENDFVEKIVENQYKDILIDESCKSGIACDINLDLKKFNQADDFVKGRIILLCVLKLFGSTKGIEKKHIEDVINLCKKNVGNKYLTPNKNLKIAVNKGIIQISKI